MAQDSIRDDDRVIMELSRSFDTGYTFGWITGFITGLIFGGLFMVWKFSIIF